MTEEFVILVDEEDNEIGTMEKLEAHRLGLLHRAFSVCLFNDQGEMLLQKRALKKYHSPGLWTNACCSHPHKGESVLEAATRRLEEEMGISAEVEEIFSLTYRRELDQNMIEHEYDHVLFGRFNGTPNINKDEVADWKYLKSIEILNQIKLNPNEWTEWFKIIMPKIYTYYTPTLA
jgi:isopentenyl-diphosphate Delta-isomerase